MADARPIIIIKKKGGHGGHHGGAWKVAYADFVTAMMALFIVLWLMSADEELKKAVSSFFSNSAPPSDGTGLPCSKKTPASDSNNSMRSPSDVTVIST